MARNKLGVDHASPEARAAAGFARRAVRVVITRGASIALELKLLAVAVLALTAFTVVLGAVMIMAGGKAEALTDAGVTPTCNDAVEQAPPEKLMPIYVAAADKYGLGEDGWSYLAAINRIESGFGQNLSESSAHAKGWMQFIDETWATYGVDADREGGKDRKDPDDAIHSAANYLRASGAPGDWYKALYAYNHADWYVQDVKKHAERYRGECTSTTYAGTQTVDGAQAKLRSDGTALAPAEAPEDVKSIIAAANEIANKPYKWGGGHGSWKDTGYDCSGLVSYALHGAGLVSSPLNSSGFMSWGGSGPGRWVSIYAHHGHVFMIVAGLRLDTGGGDRQGSAWRAADRTRKRSFAGFVVRHPPGL